MTTPKAVGIDLGTTYSAVAWIGPSGRTEMVHNAEGDILTPSVVLFEDKQVAVGREARRVALTEPDRVAQWVKRDMGQKVYSRPICGNYLPPEVIQACILKRLKTDLTTVLGPDTRVVITVPAYFDEPRRKATADAGQMAGLNVLDIVNEPTAAALAFGESIGYLSDAGETTEALTVLVYDLGGGTFDVTLLQIAPGNVQCLSTDGDVQLGGYDWDRRLVDHLAEAFLGEYDEDPRLDPVSQGRLIERAVEAKHALSMRIQTTVHVEHQGKSLDVVVTRDEFAEMTADLLERTLFTCRRIVADAGTRWQNVDRLLLVGGSTRMPMVAEALKQLTGLAPDRSINPDEAVARGAALYARYLLANGAEASQTSADAPFQVHDVNAHTLGIEGIEPVTLRKTNVRVLPRNMPLPARHTEQFTTKAAGQRTITLRVLQGENPDPDECSLIGRTVLADLPHGLPANWPVEVSFDYQANGRLAVRAVVPGTDRELAIQFERTMGLSGDQLDHWKPLISSEAGFDAFEAMVVDLLDDEEEEEPEENAPPASSNAPRASNAVKVRPQSRTTAATTPRPRPLIDVSKHDVSVKPVARNQNGRSSSRWLVPLFLWLTSAIAGLAAGYYVLTIWYPDRFRLPW